MLALIGVGCVGIGVGGAVTGQLSTSEILGRPIVSINSGKPSWWPPDDAVDHVVALYVKHVVLLTSTKAVHRSLVAHKLQQSSTTEVTFLPVTTFSCVAPVQTVPAC